MNLELKALRLVDSQPGLYIYRLSVPPHPLLIKAELPGVPARTLMKLIWQLYKDGFLTKQKVQRNMNGIGFNTFTQYQLSEKGQELLKGLKEF